MFLDKNGRIFGKINILDLIIVLFIVIVLVVGGLFLESRGKDISDKVKVRYTVEVITKDDEYISHIVEGEKVVDGVTKQDMGTIVGYTAKDAMHLKEDMVGKKFVASKVEGKKDVYITMELLADVNYPDILSGTNEIKIGEEAALRSESVAMHGYIVDIDYDLDEIRGRK